MYSLRIMYSLRTIQITANFFFPFRKRKTRPPHFKPVKLQKCETSPISKAVMFTGINWVCQQILCMLDIKTSSTLAEVAKWNFFQSKCFPWRINEW